MDFMQPIALLVGRLDACTNVMHDAAEDHAIGD